MSGDVLPRRRHVFRPAAGVERSKRWGSRARSALTLGRAHVPWHGPAGCRTCSGRLPELLFQHLADDRGVGAAAGLLHGRADEHAEELLLASAVAVRFRRVRGERPRHRRLDRAAVLDLLEAERLHARLGIAARSDELGEERLRARRGDPSGVDERDEPAERGAGEGERRERAIAGEAGEVVEEPARRRRGPRLRSDGRVEVGGGRGIAREEVSLVLREAVLPRVGAVAARELRVRGARLGPELGAALSRGGRALGRGRLLLARLRLLRRLRARGGLRRPGVAQRDGAVEDRRAGAGLDGVHEEIALTEELPAGPW